jgi:DNA-binding MarR family transcriptional regulator
MAHRSHNKPLTGADYRALAMFRHQLRQFLQFSEDAARQAGLHPRQHQALLAIKGFPGATVGNLAERLGILPHSAAGLVKRLASARLVRRVTDTKDRRRVLLTLTPAAERRLEKLTLAHRTELQRRAAVWGPLFNALEGTGGKGRKRARPADSHTPPRPL